MRIEVLGSAEVVAAFALAGVRGRTADGKGEVLAALDEIARDREVRVLAIEEEVAAMAPEEVDRLKLDPDAPLVVEVPGFGGPAEGRRTALDLVKRALGIRL